MNDQVPKVERITVAEAFRRVREAINSNDEPNRFPDLTSVCMSITMREVGIDEEIDWAAVPIQPSNAFVNVEEAGKARAIRAIPEDFRDFCVDASVVPRSLHSPWRKIPYVGGVSSFEDSSYDIAISEYEQWAAPYFQPTTPRRTAAPEENTNASIAEDAPTSAEPSKDDRPWQEIAREEADRVYLEAKALGYELTRVQVAGKVADALKKQYVRGAYGDLTGVNIEREALRGSDWKKPQPKPQS